MMIVLVESILLDEVAISYQDPHQSLLLHVYSYEKIYEKVPMVKSVERIPFNDKGSIFHAITK